MTIPVNSRDIYLQAGTRTTDEVLSKEEKPSLITNYNQILKDKDVLDADATKYGITTEKTNYDGAIIALTTYLNTLTIPISWNNTTGVTFVNRSFLDIKLNDIATFRRVLELAINAKVAVTGYLTTPTASLTANSSGVIFSTTPGNGVFKVFNGSTDITGAGPVYSLIASSGLTISIDSSTGIYLLTALPGFVGTATFRAVYNAVTLDLNYSVSKSQAGTSGTSGSDGQRGTVTVAVSGYSAWPSTTAGANSAFATTGYSTPVDRDIMTLYNSSFSQTRYYQSGSWLILTAYVNGNMLVSGTLSASVIAGGTLTGVTINIGSGFFTVSSLGILQCTSLAYFNSGASVSGGISFPSLSSSNTSGFPALSIPQGKIQVSAFSGSTNEAMFNTIKPITDNAYDCGTSSFRWSNIYSSNSVIQTSDNRIKDNIEESNLGLDFINSLRPVSYTMKIGQNIVEVLPLADGPQIPNAPREINIIAKPGTRKHYGLIAQEVRTSLNDDNIAIWSLGDPTDPESTQALSYSELISPIIKAIQELNNKIKQIESHL